jgi:hypothetical protein
LAFDSSGNLFVATNTFDSSGFFHGTIFKITPTGLMSTFATGFEADATHDFFLQGLVIDSAGDVFVTAEDEDDPNLASTIYEITSDGTTISVFGSTLGQDLGLAFDSGGNLFVAGTGSPNPTDPSYQAIFKFTAPFAAPNVPSLFAETSDFPASTGPAGLAFDASGNLFVSTEWIASPNPPGEILEFPPGFVPGGMTNTIATGLPYYPRGITFDAGGNLFVAQTGAPPPGDILEISAPDCSVAYFDQNFPSGPNNRGPHWLAFTTGSVTPPSMAVALTSPNATTPLTTSVASVSPAPTPPPNFEVASNPPLAFEISATTSPTPPIIIAFSSTTTDLSQFSVVHYVCSPNCSWVDSTLNYQCDNQNPPNCGWVDSTQTFHPAGQGGYPSSPAPNTVYASVNSFSPFLITKFKFRAQIQQPINSNGSSVFNVRRGAVPVIFTLTSDGASTCQLPPATISVFRTSGGAVGSVDESTYLLPADSGANFRVSGCQYVYNLGASALGTGTYLVNISIGGSVAGTATFALR